jgi:hypothetical protein
VFDYLAISVYKSLHGVTTYKTTTLIVESLYFTLNDTKYNFEIQDALHIHELKLYKVKYHSGIIKLSLCFFN